MSKRYTKKLTSIFISIIIVIAGFIAVYSQTQNNKQTMVTTNEEFIFRMFDIGIGDSFLISCGNQNMLIDAGENDAGDEVINYLKELNINKLDYIMATHAHSDHIGGMDYVIKNIEVDKILMSEIDEKSIPTNQTYTDLLNAIKEKGLKITKTKAGDEFNLGNAKVEVIGPVKVYEELNDTSIVAKVTYGNTSVLLTGDMESKAEKDLIKSCKEKNISLKSDILKVGHHGSTTSTTTKFLNEVSPKIAAISVNNNNKYNHPHDETINNLNKINTEIYLTKDCNNVAFLSDGKKFNVICQNKDCKHNKEKAA